ncbi:gamma-tubulin complex component 5 isoform X1 [Nasonia vitripennis]|uniref:Gamma-tubulin complex component n=1 Tax=Nasonia vitripennis TaxID=7425 RepID=A0A7M7M2I4_NASVI|nr:gamma-tubulin complex component 5 isoform X1 [Nasonia vitripennis]
MGTKTLTDIHNDLKLLITAISGFEEGEEGFQICERFALSQIKHHRYLSVNSHAVKKEIEEITQKFLIHGKYDVAKEFQELVKSFLTNFDFERHPQYDVQWSLLSLLLNLANETNKSELNSSSQPYRDRSQNITITAEDDKSEEIDWGQYLKEGQEDFFCNYDSDSDSEWSEDENNGQLSLSIPGNQKTSGNIQDATNSGTNIYQSSIHDVPKSLPQEIISKNWLKTNIQNSWWNELDWHQYKVKSEFEAAHLYEHWRKNTLKSNKIIGTLSEYQACREILWMFHIQSSMALFQEETGSEFSIRDVSIPSLTTVAFKSMLLSYYQYFTMIREMVTFLENIFNHVDTSVENRKPPLTYEAYAITLQQQLLRIKSGLVDFEIAMMKQEDQKTFLSISKNLKRYLDRVKMIFEIHKSVVEDWKKMTNWQAASKLLSCLYFKMQNSSSYETVNLCATLYLASLSVYLNIVDVWLSEGRLEDWREEFIIARCTESTESVSREDSRPLEGFASRELDPLCLKDPVMKVLLHKVYQMGRSIELLVTLDRISDLWDMMDQENVAKKTLHEECLNEILSQCSKYDDTNSSDYTDSGLLRIVEFSTSQSFDTDVEHNIMQQVSASNNPFYAKALENFILSDASSDNVDAKSSSCNQLVEWKQDEMKCKQSLEFLSKLEMVLPWRKIFECAVSKVLELKFSGASKLVKDILIREYKLEEQLKLMRSVYMMETSHIMNKFTKLIFTEIESNGMWNNAYFVTCLLEEVLSQQWPDTSSRWSITVSNIRTTKVLEAVNGIKLHYAAGWPINMLLNEEALDKYNKIFRFELKLKWALWTLNNLRFADLESQVESVEPDIVQHFHIRRLESLRFWLLHAVGSIHAYLSGQVLQSLGSTLEKALTQADNFEAIITIHSEYLDNVHEHCLQTEKFDDLTRTIYKLLEMCEDIRDRWQPTSLAFIGKALDELENDYVKYHTYLALGLHNAVQHKDADYHKLLLPVFPAMHCKFRSMRDNITDLGRNILNEIAYQSLPPSGIPLQLPNRSPRRRDRKYAQKCNFSRIFFY